MTESSPRSGRFRGAHYGGDAKQVGEQGPDGSGQGAEARSAVRSGRRGGSRAGAAAVRAETAPGRCAVVCRLAGLLDDAGNIVTRSDRRRDPAGARGAAWRVRIRAAGEPAADRSALDRDTDRRAAALILSWHSSRVVAGCYVGVRGPFGQDCDDDTTTKPTMDRSLLRACAAVISSECRGIRRAVKLVNDGVKAATDPDNFGTDGEKAWDGLLLILTHAAALSRLLFPSTEPRKGESEADRAKRADRGRQLREWLEVMPKSPLNPDGRKVRNTVEHWDERIDIWYADAIPKAGVISWAILRDQISTRTSITSRPTIRRRISSPTGGTPSSSSLCLTKSVACSTPSPRSPRTWHQPPNRPRIPTATMPRLVGWQSQ